MDRFFKTFKRPKQTLKGKDTGLKVHGIGNGVSRLQDCGETILHMML